MITLSLILLKFLLSIISAAFAGWVAGVITGSERSFLQNFMYGIVGGMLFSFIVHLITGSSAHGTVASIIGAIVLTLIVNKFSSK